MARARASIGSLKFHLDKVLAHCEIARNSSINPWNPWPWTPGMPLVVFQRAGNERN